MIITEEQQSRLVAHLESHLLNLIQERHVGLSEYHHGHQRQFEFAQSKDIEILDVKTLIAELLSAV
jgi:hypothetical protein